jgi:hypothetical protein
MIYMRKWASPLSAAEWSAFIDAINRLHGVPACPTTYDEQGRPT